MRRFVFFAVVGASLLTVAAFAAVASAGNILVTNGSPAGLFSHNKQNEPAVAVDEAHPQFVAAGSNDEIDIEDCNPGNPTSCPFTAGVGVSGVYLSTNGGASYAQPIYQGFTARQCNFDPPGSTCTPGPGPIGTLPRYFENGLVSDGDPALAFGPQPDGHGGFTYAAGSRLYYVTLTSNFSSERSEEAFKGFEAVAVSRLDTQDFGRAIAGDNTAWKAPVIVSKQNAALFSDKEQVWADNAQSSPFFGNVYVCNVGFRSQERSANAVPEPVLFTRSTDGGETWSGQKQLTAATNNSQTGGRQGCAVRTDSKGVVYVYFEGFDRQANSSAFFQVRSFDGGVTFERPREISLVTECGLFDPNTGRFSFDGVAGARTDSFPSVDIANGAPSGADATNEIVLTYCNGPTPSTTNPGPNEQAIVKVSTNGGESFRLAGSASPASDRPDFPAIAISPDGRDVYVTYTNFLQPWQPTTAAARLANGVSRHADVNPATGAIGPFADLERDVAGDARGSSQNGLTAEFLGDYNYAAATRDFGLTVFNDVRHAADCPAVDAWRQSIADGSPTAKPAPNIVCPTAFGNSDIFGGMFADPTAP